MRTSGEQLAAWLDGAPAGERPIRRGEGAQIGLRVPAGAADFDDVDLRVLCADVRGGYYAFARRETDWWREGGQWLDHGGISCVLASNWISLVAPKGQGYLWNKREFGPDAVVSFDIEENSEWFGWDASPSHRHHAFDNIHIVLAPRPDARDGYRLEVNAQNRSATVLYRQDREVARVAQNGAFPMRHDGGHAPYTPRRNRITLSKRGGLLRCLVNNREVLAWRDPEPLEARRVGVGGGPTRVNFGHLEARSYPAQ